MKKCVRYKDTDYYKVLEILYERGVVSQDDPIWDQFKNITKTIDDMKVFSLASTCYMKRGDFNSGDGYCISKFGKEFYKMINEFENDWK